MLVGTTTLGSSATISSPFPVYTAWTNMSSIVYVTLWQYLHLGVSIACNFFFPIAPYLARQLALSCRTIKGLMLPVHRRELNSPLEANPGNDKQIPSILHSSIMKKYTCNLHSPFVHFSNQIVDEPATRAMLQARTCIWYTLYGNCIWLAVTLLRTYHYTKTCVAAWRRNRYNPCRNSNIFCLSSDSLRGALRAKNLSSGPSASSTVVATRHAVSGCPHSGERGHRHSMLSSWEPYWPLAMPESSFAEYSLLAVDNSERRGVYTCTCCLLECER